MHQRGKASYNVISLEHHIFDHIISNRLFSIIGTWSVNKPLIMITVFLFSMKLRKIAINACRVVNVNAVIQKKVKY